MQTEIRKILNQNLIFLKKCMILASQMESNQSILYTNMSKAWEIHWSSVLRMEKFADHMNFQRTALCMANSYLKWHFQWIWLHNSETEVIRLRLHLWKYNGCNKLCTCWWTSVIDIVKWRKTLIVAKTTAPFACWSLSSSRFIMSKISLLSDGRNFDTNSRTKHCAHSLNSLILQLQKKKSIQQFK